MLKRIVLSLSLIFAVVAVSGISGCHAEAKTDKGHGVEVGAG